MRLTVLLVSLPLLAATAGCGSSTISDANSPQAAQCRAALKARVDSADAAAANAPSDVAAQAAIANSLAGTKPKECAHISDALGAQLLNELASAATARASAARDKVLNGLRQAVSSSAPSPTASPNSTP